MLATSAPLVAVELIAASIWVGGMACIAVVAKVAREALDEASQVAFFRFLGRSGRRGGHHVAARGHHCGSGARLVVAVVIENDRRRPLARGGVARGDGLWNASGPGDDDSSPDHDFEPGR